MADQQNPKAHQIEEQNDPNGPVVQYRKTGLECGDENIITIHRPSVIIDSHMHIQSGNCATLQFIRGSAFFPVNKLARGSIEGAGLGASYFLDALCEWLLIPILHPVRAMKQAITDDPQNPDQSMIHTSPIRQLLERQKGSTLEIGKAFMKERDNVLNAYFQTQPEYKDLSHLALAAVVMTMDMEYAHLDGYYGLRINNVVYADKDFSKPIGYWYPCHGNWEKRGADYVRQPGPAHLLPDYYTKSDYDRLKEQECLIGAYPTACGQYKAMRIEAAPVMMPESETERYEHWQRQLQYTEQAMLTYPLKMLPMYHFDPRRWQFQPEKKGPNRLDDLFDNVKEGGLYLGFKMYTAQGYRPWDVNRLPILADFYAECSRLCIPILNHCTPKGAVTVEQDLYYDFVHPNDTDKEKEEKANIAKNFKSQEKEQYFSENFVSPNAWRNVLNSSVEGRNLRDLHLCLAHFGGPTDQGREWSEQIIDMMTTYPNFYTDISSSFASDTFRNHFKKIIQTHHDRGIIKKRVLFGTDWYMTLLYTKPFHGMDYWEYCTKTKEFLDEFDTSLWSLFTMHNPYRFYRLNEQVPRIAESIIARGKIKIMRKKGKIEDEEMTPVGIQKEAAWIRQANDGLDI